jgi:hypothetical protein
MPIRAWLERLLHKAPQDSGFTYKIDQDEVSFYLPSAAFAACAAGTGDELALTQYIHLQMLAEQGLAEPFANGFAMVPEDVIRLEPDLRFLLQLPDVWPGSFELMSEGTTFQSTYRIALSFPFVDLS